MKNYSFFSIKPRFFLILATISAVSLCAEGARLNIAWRELAAAATEYTNRGVSLPDVIEESLTFGASDSLTAKAVNLYVTLVGEVFTNMRQRTNFETSRALRDTQAQLFGTILQHPGARQRVAHAVFKNYKKWNISFTSWSGDVERADVVVFSSFLGSLNQVFFKGIVGAEASDISLEDFSKFRAQVLRLLKVVKPNELGVLAREEKNKALYAVKAGAKSISKKAKAATSVVTNTIKQVSLKNVFYTVGAASAMGFFLLGSYAFIYRKKVLREFGAEIVKFGGGMPEVAKEAALLYTLPETRWKRIFGRVKDWVYNDPDIRKGRAVKLQKELLIPGTQYVPTCSSEHDELTSLLKYASTNPQAVKPGMADRVKKEWVEDLRRRDLLLKKRKAEARLQSRKESNFRKAASRYLEILTRQERDLGIKA